MTDMTTPDTRDGDTEGDFWRDVKPMLKQRSQDKRASNRDNGYAALLGAGVRFDCNNDGAHLVVYHRDAPFIDYWPGTGLWRLRGSPVSHRGLQRLLQRIGTERNRA